MQVDNESISALAHMQELKKGMAIPAGEFVSKRKDGSIGQHIFSATPVVHFGEVTGFEWFIIDITEHKKLEADKLLLQQQFHQSQKLESLGVLAGGIAHDFNNILTVIVSGCSLARLRPERTAAQLDMIESAALRAAGLCNQMLTYAGKGQSALAQTDVGEMVREMVTMLRSTINQNVTITFTLEDDIPLIKADISQLRQLVMNLIINASEAIGAEQGTIDVGLNMVKIGVAAVDKDHLGKTIPMGWYACLKVRDSGCGMDEETRSRIFEPFFSTKFTGRGLGMSALLGIVNLHGGALQLNSKPGQGTIFKVYLPIMICSADAVTPVLPAVITPWKGSGTILLVEDDEMILDVTRTMLEEMGFSVIEARNGQEGLNLYQQKTAEIDLVLTDIGMPVMDGYALFSALKKISPKLPIIISSGFGDFEVTQRIVGEKIAGLISKPYLFSQLQALIKSVVEASPGGAKA
jgi:signal transduction histidine kinase/CheY-like chemotaxis protein